jgi:hypothetical protein
MENAMEDMAKNKLELKKAQAEGKVQPVKNPKLSPGFLELHPREIKASGVPKGGHLVVGDPRLTSNSRTMRGREAPKRTGAVSNGSRGGWYDPTFQE